MDKKSFLREVEKGISALSKNEKEKSLAYYSEMIDDRIEDGMTEAEAVGAVGSVEEAVAQIIRDYSPVETHVIKKERRKLRGWEIALIIIGSPLWASLLIAAAAIVLALYIVVFSVVVSLWAVAVSLAASSLGCLFGAVFVLANGVPAEAALIFGAALICAGLAILAAMLSVLATRGAVSLVKLGIGLAKKRRHSA